MSYDDALNFLIKASFDKAEAETLLKIIEKNVGQTRLARAGYAYGSLASLVKEVNDRGLNKITLDIGLLQEISQALGIHTSFGYDVLSAFARAGVIKDDNVDDVKDLLRTITEPEKDNTWRAYSALESLAKTVEAEDLNKIVLDIDLLKWIAKIKEDQLSNVYKGLESLAKAVKAEGLDDGVLDLELLKALAQGTTNPVVRVAYSGLEALARAVKEERLDDVVLDRQLLMAIARTTGDGAEGAYEALVPLAQAVKHEKINKNVLDIALLESITEMTRENTSTAYRILKVLASVDGIKADDFEWVKEFLQPVNQLQKKPGGHIYHAVNALAAAGMVKKDNFDEIINFLKTIVKNVGDDPRQAYSSFQSLVEHKVVRDDNFNEIKRSFIAIAQSAADMAYLTLESLARAGAVNADNFDRIKDLLQTIAQNYSDSERRQVYHALISLARATRRKDVLLDMDILETIAQNTEKKAADAYEGLASLVKDWIIAQSWGSLYKGVDEIVFDRNLLLAIAQVAGDGVPAAYKELIKLGEELKSAGLQEMALNTNSLEMITRSAKRYAKNAYKALKALARAGVVNEGNIEEIQNLITAIAEKMGDAASLGYESLKTLAEAGIVQEDNLDKIESLITSIGKTSSNPVKVPDFSKQANIALVALVLSGVVSKSNTEEVEKVLIIIAEKCGRSADAVYQIFGALARVEIVTAHNMTEAKDLFIMISREAAGNAANIFKTLNDLVKSVEEKRLSRNVLELNLLTKYFQLFGKDAYLFYGSLKDLAEAVKAGGSSGKMLQADLLMTVSQNLSIELDDIKEEMYIGLALLDKLVEAKGFSDTSINELMLGLKEGVQIVSAYNKSIKNPERNIIQKLIGHFHLKIDAQESFEGQALVSAREISLDFFKQRGAEDDFFQSLVPENVREEIYGSKLEEIFIKIDQENYLKQPYLAAVYLKIIKSIPMAIGLTYPEFLSVVQGGEDSQYSTLIIRFIEKHIFQRETQLTKSQQKRIVALSIALHKHILEKVDGAKQNVTFRELARFNIDFSRFYLQQQGLEKTLEFFILTAHNIYGRVLKNDNDKNAFIHLIGGLFKSPDFRGLVGEAQMDSEDLRGDIIKVLNNIIKYADYENLDRTPQDNEVPLRVSIRSLLERARQVQGASLLMVDDNNTLIVDEVLDDLAVEEDTIMLRLPINGFSKRRELFGMYIPKEALSTEEVNNLVISAEVGGIKQALKEILALQEKEVDSYYDDWQSSQSLKEDVILKSAIASFLKYGEKWQELMNWQDGLLVKVAQAATKNLDKQYYINFDNISAMPDTVRLLLNPVMWERMVEIPERSLSLTIPDNLNFILTMHKDTEIKDESFMNRPLVQYVDALSTEDMRKYLKERFGLEEVRIKELTNIYSLLSSLKLTENVVFSFTDIIDIAKRVKGLAEETQKSEEEILWKEAYDYLYLRVMNERDREILREKVFNGKDFDSPEILVNRIDGTIIFDGVVLVGSKGFLEYVENNHEKSFRELARGYKDFAKDGYIVTEMEARVLSQLARAYRYGNRVVQIEGPSGEGKTEVGRVFSKLIGLGAREYTINQETDLSEFRGQIRPTRDRRYELYEPNYLKEVDEGNHAFLFNEINTNEAGALYYWLFPEIAQRAKKDLGEFAVDHDDLVKTLKIDQNNLWLFTVNPESFHGRGMIPPRIRSHVTTFYMAQDLDSLPQTTEGLFKRNQLDRYLPYSNKLASIHRAFRELKEKQRIESPQDITPRELISVTDKFRHYLKEGMEAESAFRRAIDEVYVYMWKELKDVQQARVAVNENLGYADGILGREVLEAALTKKGRPVLVFFNGANNLNDLLKKEVLSSDKETVVRHIPLSHFHHRRQFVGGLIPSEQVESRDGRWQKLNELSAQFEESLGIIPELIKETRFNPRKEVLSILYNYTHLNPQVAPLLNEFFQTGRLEGVEDIVTLRMAEELIEEVQRRGGALWDDLRSEYGRDHTMVLASDLSEEQKLQFAQWFYGEAPDNLRFIATGSSEEKVTLSPAEINRFLPVNIAQDLNKEWINGYISGLTDGSLAVHAGLIKELIHEVFNLYEKQRMEMEYEYNRMSRLDIDAFLKELRDTENLNEQSIKKVAFYSLGIGLRPDYRAQLKYSDAMENPTELIRYEQRSDGIYLMVDGIKYLTKSENIPSLEFLAPTKNLVQQLAAMIIALKYNRVLAIEGHPGGGKTASVEDLARRLGLPVYNQMMYEDIDLGEFLGKLSKEGKKFVLTSRKKDLNEKYVIPFLRAYSQGGLFLLDEGAIGLNSQEVISFLVELSLLDEFNLGIFHPGFKEEVLKKHKDFHLVIAQNPARTTKAREPLPYRVDTIAHKIWTDNILRKSDAVRIIDYHLDQADKVPQDIKNEIAEVHIELSKVHPKKESLSPRQLIMIARTINQAIENGEEIEKAVFEGIMISYLTGLSGDDLKKMLDVIGKKTQNNLLHYIGEWKDAIDVTHNKTYVQFNGTKLPKSITKGNVKEEDVIYREDLPSQSQALRSMALGMSLNMPLAVFEEEGSDALDLIKKFSYLVNYELHTLWSHPQMTRMQILSAILPKFEAQLDRYGVKQEDLSDEFVMSLGFLVRHLMLQKDYDELKEEQRSEQVQKVLFFHLMDAIPERQRVLLNELLTTGKMELTNEKGEPQRYVLPEWVHFVVSASLEHDFSSAFINRFLPIRLNSILKLDELKNVVQNRYPLVKDYEVSWIRKIAMAVSKYDKNEVFGIHYGYSVRDIYKLARLIHLEKQGDIKKGEFNTNPLYYMLKAAHIVYGLGLEDGDRKKYEEEIIKEHFLGSLVMGGTPEEIENLYSKLKTLIEFKLAKVQREVYDLHVDISSIESGRNVVLENGINIQKTEQGFVISTRDANVYHVYEALDDWKELSEGLKIKREENQLIFSLNLLQSVGEVPFPRDENNRSVSLPEDEVPTREFVRYTDQVNRLMAGTLRGWQRVQDGLGGVRSPRVMMWNGHTGTAKTTLARNLSRVWGVPIYILNAYEEMKVSDITVGLKFQEGTFEIGIKEFLARVGKINGQRIAIASKETSSRKILLIDEANASPDMLYALAPLFRGEKKFSVEYAGENFKVEVDDEVLIILTFNPSEKYAGRGGFSRDIVSYADKLWMPNPLNYQEDVLASILSEYHRRGITSQKKNIKKQEPQEVTISKERHVKSEPYIVKVEELEHPQVQNLKEVLLPNEKRKTRESEGAEESLSDEGAKRKAPIERVQLNYDVEKIKANARRFVEGDGYKNFAVGVLEEGFLYSLADNNMDGELEMEVINAAGRLDSQVQKALEDLIKIYARKSHKLSEVYEKILEMRRIFARNRVALFIVRKSVQKKYSYFGLVVEEIERIVVFDENKLKKIGEDPSKYQNIAISAIVTEGDKYGAEEKGIAGFFEGEYAYAFKGASLAGARAAGFKDVDKHEQELVDWTADHELGHVMDLLRIRSRGINIAKNIKWSQLAQDVNRQNKGIWLSENVELNSMLFPIIFSSNPKEYIMQELIRIVKTHKDYKDAYVQASKGILNGFLSYFEEKGKIRDVKLISNSLEDEHVEVILNFIEENYFDEKDSEELNQIGAIIYKEAEKYLKTTGKGIYRRKEVTGVGGDSMEEVIYGDMAQPDIEKEYVEGKEGDGYEFDTPQAQEGRSITVAESKQYAEGGSGGQEGGEDQGEQVGQSKGEGLQGVGEVLDDKDIDASGIAQDISKLQEVAPNLVAKFLDIFAGSPKTLKIYSDTGDEIDIERIITGDLEPFYRAKVMEGLASLSAGITVDISGSTSGELRASFIEMTKLYSSLFYYSAVRNKGVSFSISAVGDHFHSILDFDNSRDKLAVENAITLFDKIQDWGGINTLSVIEGIRKKYLNQKDKSHKLELIFTDGGETSGESFEDLRKKVEDLEKELGIDIVFVGIGTRDVENYSKYINIDYLPPTEELSQLIINLSLLKISRGTLPYGDLKEFVGMDSGKSSSSVSSPVAKQNFRQDIKSLDRIGSFRGDEEKEIGGIDLSRDALNLEIKRNSRGIPLPIQMQNIENININGFVPIIINISPIMNFPLFSGLSNEPGNPKTTKNADQEPSRTLPVDRLSQFYTRDPFFAVDFSSHNAPVS
ncbi:MAG: AAA family ATPase [Candidatus Omnitrophica bacterium]|nr:AAA family ATPase [Candidatus Omnitrophota bacterium]